MKTAWMWTAVAAVVFAVNPLSGQKDDWQSSFTVDKRRLGPSGNNAYFVLTPGLKLHYQQGKNALTTTVLDETKVVDGVTCRVVEDRETKNGRLVELTRDYFAADSKTNDVYYFGEDIDNFKNGKLANHAGAWLSGSNGARFGLMMPGAAKAGVKHYQELAPGAAMDRAEIVSVTENITTPAGKFANCVKVKETNPLEKGATDYKWYAPGVGLVKDGELVLARIEKAR